MILEFQGKSSWQRKQLWRHTRTKEAQLSFLLRKEKGPCDSTVCLSS